MESTTAMYVLVLTVVLAWCRVQAFCRNIQYKQLPPDQITAAPEAKFFPGLPPAGTTPLGDVTVMVRQTRMHIRGRRIEDSLLSTVVKKTSMYALIYS